MSEKEAKIPNNVKRFSITISFASALMIGLMLLALSLSAEAQTPTPYAINFAKQVSGANNVVVLPATTGAFNCTGITTGALTTLGNKAIVIYGTYSAASINQTNWFEFVEVTISTSVPSVSFGSGTCAAITGGQRWIMSMYFPVTGNANWFSQGFSFTFNPVIGATYYAWIDIQQRGGVGGSGTGHINYRSEGLSASSIGMQEDI